MLGVNHFLLYPTLGITDQLFDGYIQHAYIFVLARGSISNTLLRPGINEFFFAE